MSGSGRRSKRPAVPRGGQRRRPAAWSTQAASSGSTRRRARDPAARRRRPDTEIETAEKAHADLFEVVQDNRCGRRPSSTSTGLPIGSRKSDANWSISIGQGDQSLRLHRRDPRCLRRGLPAAAPLPRRRRGAPDVEVWIRALMIVGVLYFPDRRGDRLPGRPAAAAVRRRDLHGGSRRHRHVPRTGRAAHRHHRGRPLGQRLHRPDRHHAGQPGSRCHAHDRAQPDRMAGHAAHPGAGDLACRCSPSGAT